MGDLGQALDQARLDGGPPSLAAVRRYASRGGVSLNFEQQISDDLGLFARAGVADGRKEVFEFTDIDDTAAAGVSLNGNRWGRPDDVIGLAGVVNEISSLRRAYLDAGGLGLLIGDGRLPHAGPETIIETNYDWAAMKGLNLTIDYQFIANPAYNEDRGPVSVLGARLHLQY
jgi:high affinity Mn2+ porin